MHILVTGGAGYVGSATALTSSPRAPLTVLDNLATGYRAAIPEGAAFVRGDLAIAARSTCCSRRTRSMRSPTSRRRFEAGESMVLPGKYFENNVACTNGCLRR